MAFPLVSRSYSRLNVCMSCVFYKYLATKIIIFLVIMKKKMGNFGGISLNLKFLLYLCNEKNKKT